MHSARGKGGASFPLQIFLHLGRFFSVPWFVITLALLIYKGVKLPFPQDVALPLEIVSSFLVMAIHWVAVNVGIKGNLTESPRLLLLSILLNAVILFGIIYFMWLQTYVMRLDLGVSATYLSLVGLTFVFSLVGLQNIAGDGLIRPTGFSG
ncbi:membrane-associated protein, putative [Bodo saltans]|uniref:Membrane-associated protein, putative n=1 Tax=Bodo saltans TaxID=75058 RepID=A0A0S4KJD7_BODSA|nr:membrane-associated protein, putative [Bodo saltans]|eukprot:CUI14653.1 membrane-associated protein, putative [Bodo saltans]